jgi:hypothetical protein
MCFTSGAIPSIGSRSKFSINLVTPRIQALFDPLPLHANLCCTLLADSQRITPGVGVFVNTLNKREVNGCILIDVNCTSANSVSCTLLFVVLANLDAAKATICLQKTHKLSAFSFFVAKVSPTVPVIHIVEQPVRRAAFHSIVRVAPWHHVQIDVVVGAWQ